MLRSALLWLSERESIFNFVKRNGLARQFAHRFVAGESLDTAIEATREINGRDITVTLDLLGESVSDEDEARSARDQAQEILDRIHAGGHRANISVKLTQLGIDVDPELATENIRAVVSRARRYDNFVRIDMEASEYVERTLNLFRTHLHPDFGNRVGVVIQSMLRRSDADVEQLVQLGARVRLVKGAYKEPEDVAYPDKADVDACFARLTERLLADGTYPAIATHDETLIEHTKAYARAHGIGPGRFEFQLLYGVRRDLQEALRKEGWNVRVYVPFGTQWYPYLMRRLAERPANIAFIVGNVLRETFGGRK